MDCKHARMLLEVAHPIATQLEPAETAALASHLADCPDCGFVAEAERRVDEKFTAAMRDVPVPEGLKERIGRRLQGERDAWWRVRVLRAFGTAAAACLLALAGWLYVYCTAEWLFIQVGLWTLAAGLVVFLVWAYERRGWPFVSFR